MDIAEALRKLTVGRIAYCVVAAIPLTVFFQLVLDPGQTKDDRFGDFLLGWLLVFINVPVVLVGLGTLIRQRRQQQPVIFWTIAVLVAAIPLVFIILSVILEATTGVHIRPFT